MTYSRRKFSRADLERIVALSKGCCHICGQPVKESNWHREHVLPLADGGKDEVSNIRMAHDKCHRLKTVKEAAERAKANAAGAAQRGTTADSPWRGFPKREKPPKELTKPLPPRRPLYVERSS